MDTKIKQIFIINAQNRGFQTYTFNRQLKDVMLNCPKKKPRGIKSGGLGGHKNGLSLTINLS